MRTIHRFLFATAVTALLAASASAQMSAGGGGGGGNSGGGSGGGGFSGGQGGSSSNSSATGLPFGGNGAVGVTSQSFQSTNASGVSSSNVLGGYYANPFYQGRIGSTGSVSPGGFGAVLYSANSTSGGMTGAGGRAGGMGSTGRTGGGASTSGFGSTTGSGFGSTTGGGRGGSTGGFGSTGGGFGSTGSVGGGGGFGGGMGGMGGMNSQNQNVVRADRPVGVFMNQTAASPSFTRTPMTMKAQTELRTTFDNSTYLASGKVIGVNMTDAGIVHLSGKVSSDEEKKLAISLAQMTPGVRQVVSELTVQPKP